MYFIFPSERTGRRRPPAKRSLVLYTLSPPRLRACLNSLQGAWERAEWNEAASGHLFRSYLKKRVWVHAESWASLAESA